jgi:DNA-binding LacI/PurR family transcriptional regulator
LATIYDVAKAVGCAPSTVSKYLTKNGYVSAQLGERIAKAMQELDYHYNGMAVNLSKNINDRIGVLVPLLDHPYFQELTSAISIAAAKQGKEVVLMPTNYQTAREQRFLDELEHRLVGSLIVTSHQLPYQKISQYQRFGSLVFCEDLADDDLKTVRTNRLAVFKQLFERLKKEGDRKIGFLMIRPADQSRSTREAFQAYRAVFGRQPNSDYVRYSCRTLADGRRRMHELLPVNLDAVLTEGDATAAGAFQELRRAGQQTVVIGQGNQLPSQLLGFTSIDQCFRQMGQAAVDLALHKQDQISREIKFKIIWR